MGFAFFIFRSSQFCDRVMPKLRNPRPTNSAAAPSSSSQLLSLSTPMMVWRHALKFSTDHILCVPVFSMLLFVRSWGGLALRARQIPRRRDAAEQAPPGAEAHGRQAAAGGDAPRRGEGAQRSEKHAQSQGGSHRRKNRGELHLHRANHAGRCIEQISATAVFWCHIRQVGGHLSSADMRSVNIGFCSVSYSCWN